MFLATTEGSIHLCSSSRIGSLGACRYLSSSLELCLVELEQRRYARSLDRRAPGPGQDQTMAAPATVCGRRLTRFVAVLALVACSLAICCVARGMVPSNCLPRRTRRMLHRNLVRSSSQVFASDRSADGKPSDVSRSLPERALAADTITLAAPTYAGLTDLHAAPARHAHPLPLYLIYCSLLI
jgi:hypothetical protein